jgi:hypothetical protein
MGRSNTRSSSAQASVNRRLNDWMSEGAAAQSTSGSNSSGARRGQPVEEVIAQGASRIELLLQLAKARERGSIHSSQDLRLGVHLLDPVGAARQLAAMVAEPSRS